MPRRTKGPRLYLDKSRRTWVIRDGSKFDRTGCADDDAGRNQAEKYLAQYIASKYAPKKSPSPAIVDVLLAYSKGVIPYRRTAKNMTYCVGTLMKFWGDKLVSDINAINCRDYAATRSSASANVELRLLKAAIHHWHAEHGPLAIIPKVVVPQSPPRRERFLSRSEAAALLCAARRVTHLRRFILLGLHTGSRPGVIYDLQWSQIDLDTGLMLRRRHGHVGAKNKKAPPVRLGRKILSHLRRWSKIDAGRQTYVVHYNGTKIKDAPHASWDRAVSNARLQGKVTPHTLRHTRATWLMQKKADKWMVAGHLGMSVRTLESVYGHHHPDYSGGVEDL